MPILSAERVLKEKVGSQRGANGTLLPDPRLDTRRCHFSCFCVCVHDTHMSFCCVSCTRNPAVTGRFHEVLDKAPLFITYLSASIAIHLLLSSLQSSVRRMIEFAIMHNKALIMITTGFVLFLSVSHEPVFLSFVWHRPFLVEKQCGVD